MFSCKTWSIFLSFSLSFIKQFLVFIMLLYVSFLFDKSLLTYPHSTHVLPTEDTTCWQFRGRNAFREPIFTLTHILSFSFLTADWVCLSSGTPRHTVKRPKYSSIKERPHWFWLALKPRLFWVRLLPRIELRVISNVKGLILSCMTTSFPSIITPVNLLKGRVDTFWTQNPPIYNWEDFHVLPGIVDVVQSTGYHLGLAAWMLWFHHQKDPMLSLECSSFLSESLNFRSVVRRSSWYSPQMFFR